MLIYLLKQRQNPLIFFKEESTNVDTRILECELQLGVTIRKHHITLDDDQYSNIISYMNERGGLHQDDSDDEVVTKSVVHVQTKRGRQVRLPSRYGTTFP